MFNGVYLARIGLASYLVLSVSVLNPLLALLPLLVAGLSTMVSPATDRSSKPAPSSTLPGMVLLLVGSYLVSTAFSHDVVQGLNATIGLFPGVLVYFLLREQGRTSGGGMDIYLVAAGMMLMAEVATIGIWYSTGRLGPMGYFEVLPGQALVVPNDLLLLVVLAPFAIFLSHSSHPLVFRLIGFLALILGLVAVYLVQSRLCMLGVFLMLGIQAVFSGKKQLLPFILVAMVLAVVTDWMLDFRLAHDFLELWRNNTRLSVWWVAVASFTERMVLGHGPGSYEFLYLAHAFGLADLPSWLKIDGRQVQWAHNLYLEALAERGLLGFSVLVALIVYSLKAIYSAYTHSQGEERAKNTAVLVSYATFLLLAFFELTLMRVWVVNVFFLLLALIANASEDQPRAPPHYSR